MVNIENYSLKQHNTFGIDARCDRYLMYDNPEEAEEVAAILRSQPDTPYIIIGQGSNLLLTGDFHGTVVRSHAFVAVQEGDRVLSGSGVHWDNLVEDTLNHGLYGLENLSLIPGDVGAAAVQNIGAYGVEAKDYVERVFAIEIATGEKRVFTHEEIGYGYRQSRFKREWKNKYLILQVDFRLSTTFKPRLDYGNIRSELAKRGIEEPTALQLRDVIIDIRRAKLPDPELIGNAGSFFMNPIIERSQYETLAAQYEGMPHYDVNANSVKIPAGWLIEQCGWKGRSLGRAGVYDRQALVLVNRGGATGQEILALSRQIQSDVKNKFGIEILPEVNIV